MTPSQAAQEKPTSPRTEAGRTLVQRMLSSKTDDRMGPDDLQRAIIAIEREAYNAGENDHRRAIDRMAEHMHEREAAAATPSLDTREAIIEILHRYECDEEPLPHDWREHLPYDEPEVHPNRIDALADLFARLDEGSATPDTLPPCPICGKDDLFVGRDGKPGCPHCEVAVRLPDEGSATPDQGKG